MSIFCTGWWYRLSVLGVVTCSLKMNIMWSFPMANTIVWLHYEEIIGKPIVPILSLIHI